MAHFPGRLRPNAATLATEAFVQDWAAIPSGMDSMALNGSASNSYSWLSYVGDFYHGALLPLFLLTLFLAFMARPAVKEDIPPGFSTFRLKYLVGWVFCVAADWLQGPYVYALYAAYGYSKQENAVLFVAGFASSLIFGCGVGSLVDQFGRKKSAIAYCFLYICSCVLKHFNCYQALLLGRVLGGFSTSLLFSCFECWLVAEHQRRYHFSDTLLSYMFGSMYMLMYVVAIVSGFLAQFAVDLHPLEPVGEGRHVYWGGALAPFDLAIAALLIGAVHIAVCWDENYGSDETREGGAGGPIKILQEAAEALRQDSNLWFLGSIVGCFEGAMFAFVFNWTPTLDDQAHPAPLGIIFAGFMMACMCGSCVSTIMSERCSGQCSLVAISLMAAIVFLIITLATAQRYTDACYLGFLLFEGLVGAYFPSVARVKSEVVPEHVRGTIYSLYRVPLNAVVVVLLLSDLSLIRCFSFCATLMLLSLLAAASMGKRSSGGNVAGAGAEKCK
mmetsp:Transcript_83869/g.175457  ORF Transcript_83869/g.175457 Transcript_83869/m.175457 type:complete len:501 (-) Transcript_83869:116-1618(-)|eukprot:CAMPEP_0206423586 /NCGR_PEP_ID=MMETSP0324_2-20121206/2757_1 /ASSEMBLY_ACC=CAM_ASM_000836 /TAXON_ID=2866 /ORGANISM="Crypthecodinium cohnii, Strain Seligo" /LENGTH=500 /DNA_ID=CAMNT_0053888151 /DNA_START=607 /DNA_END=2109 /DNA_ORIENTATION=+